eukprot:gnl/Hemi2/16934_TR5625_c0_g1_i1.p2 gnl/Hemi2/16934_TR5625_c0_g1~~gnl/Hemi2/16934_TR5625_c0_g1_i1.p2  ORF type:complete len:243 (-),score=102.43 gnl/Hemi2/16934_TR5625_c0_g1_i1:106-834(-)
MQQQQQQQQSVRGMTSSSRGITGITMGTTGITGLGGIASSGTAAGGGADGGLVARLLQRADYKEYLALLSQLTAVGTVTEEQFCARLLAFGLHGPHSESPDVAGTDASRVCSTPGSSSSSGGGGAGLGSTSVPGVLALPVHGSTVVVLEDLATGRLLAAATLLLEPKFAHSCGTCGHIEDVVVDRSCRGRSLGRAVVQAVVDLARNHGCYKLILDCAPSNVGFYEKLGFHTAEVQMRLDISS